MSQDEQIESSSDEVSPQERIRELNEIDHDVSRILELASKAIGLLPNEDYDTLNPKLANVKANFEELTADYFKTLSSVSVRLRRQVHGLEEAGLVNKGTRYDADRAALMNEDQSSRRDGGGPLDTSWLNARAKDTTGESMKQEILEEAKEFLRKENIDVQRRADDQMQLDPSAG